ncbi:unnamed protein product [Heligmosomoides polygyrus]|uniref:RT_RNaseH_2 domain-containing protein n=1 Tax=Heligmosomoides polygyrus TaxID=6339 RepID=A0A183GBV2_HELPZ|nr:unnamed protein product [Heligmosomoides polygyrus]
MDLVLNADDKRCTRAVAREVAKAQTEEWSHRKTWDKTQEESSELTYWQYRLSGILKMSLKTPHRDLHYANVLDVDASHHSVGAVL